MHEEKFRRISFKLNFIKQHKPKWYENDEEHIDTLERNVDDQVKRIGRQTQRKGYKPPFMLKLPEPNGINAAERGR